jgi:hypothetical protein
VEREKAIGKFRLALSQPMATFGKYGLLDDIPEAKEAIIRLALQLHEDLRPEEIECAVYTTLSEFKKTFIELLKEEARKSNIEEETQPD